MDLWGNEDAEEYRARIRAEFLGETYHFPDYEALEKAIHGCRRCPLRSEGGRGPVLSTGPSDSPLMIVGEGPGSVEDEYGGPLVGPSGQLLDKALASVGITRDHVYVTNIVKCRPEGNRTPSAKEGETCGKIWLEEEIRLVNPKVIIGLGKVALRFFLGHDAGIVRARGTWITYKNIPVMPTFHPAYLLRQTGESLREAKWQVYYDLKAAKEKAEESAPHWIWKSETMPDLLKQLEPVREKRKNGM